ncbi:hypothetical protein FOZ63_005335, partial [Perkinsus olseni]
RLTGAQLTAAAIDRSEVLIEVLAGLRRPTDLLGELQAAFVVFMLGQSFEAFEQWKALLGLFAESEGAIDGNVDLFNSLYRVLFTQLQQMPDDMLLLDDGGSSFVVHYFRRIVENGSARPSLAKRAAYLKKLCENRFGESCGDVVEVEEGEDPPVVVDTDAHLLPLLFRLVLWLSPLMPRVGSRRRKARVQQKNIEESEEARRNTPRCIIIRRGQVVQAVQDLVTDLRQVMSPNVASKLKESRKNKMQDFVAVSGMFGVSHLLQLTQTDVSPYLRITRMAQGPTLTFQVMEASLQTDVRRAQKRPKVGSMKDYAQAPMVVLNGFGDAGKKAPHLELCGTMLKSMFPSIDPKTVDLQSCRRVVLFNYDEESNTIKMRHYQ